MWPEAGAGHKRVASLIFIKCIDYKRRAGGDPGGPSTPVAAANGFARGRKEGRVLDRLKKPPGIENGIADSGPPFKAPVLRYVKIEPAACSAAIWRRRWRPAGDADACTTRPSYRIYIRMYMSI